MRARDETAAAVVKKDDVAAPPRELLADLSHDLRTPLGTILGLTDLLVTSGLTPPQAAHVAGVRRAAEQLLTSLDDVMDLARLESGRATLDRHAFDLERLVDGAIGLLSSVAQRRGVRLSLEKAGGLVPWALGDARRLKQVVTNLVLHVMKVSRSGDVQVDVRGEVREGRGSGIVVRVHDTSPGHAPAAVEGSGVRPAAPRGLELAVAERLAGLMGGELEVERSEGAGTTFTFAVGLEPAAPPATAPPAAPARGDDAEGEGRHGGLEGVEILLVDDSDETRALVRSQLAPCGVRLTAVATAEDALGRLARGTPDIVLMDMHLPGMSGVAAIAALRRAERERGASPVPVVLLSAETGPEALEGARAAGCDGQLEKPFTRGALLEALRRHARRPRARPVSLPAIAESLLPRFLANRRKDAAIVRVAIAERDFERIRTVGHNMRGNGKSYGFPELSLIGEQLEEAALARNIQRLVAPLVRLEEFVARHPPEPT